MPEKDSDYLAIFAAIIGVLAGIAGMIHPDAALASGGVGMGLWLAALFVWLRDPENVLVTL